MFQFFANIFGYVLNILNNFVGNYGLAIILFSVLVKLCMLPMAIKQQKTMKKSAKLQEQLKVLQFKYKNDPEKLNREMMDLYKKENMSPFSGCSTTIIQFILLISILYMVRLPLTYIEKIDKGSIDTYVEQLKNDGISVSQAYSEIDIIREKEHLKEKLPDDENLDKINLNMQFLGLDLGKVPQQNMGDWTVYIIPVLYIISSLVSMKITTKMQKNLKNPDKSKDVIDITENSKDNDGIENEDDGKNDMERAMEQSNKMMTWMMPLMAVSVSLVAPLGLALYWLVNNVLMICERVVVDKTMKNEEE